LKYAFLSRTGFSRTAAACLFSASLLAVPGVPAAAQSDEPIVLVGHRVSYDLKLAGVRGSKGPSAAEGRIAFEFSGNACEGYAMAFRQVTRMDDGEGNSRLSDLRSTTWEDATAKKFRFAIQSTTDGQITQQSEGTAERNSDRTIALRLARPKNMKLDFNEEPVFPSEQMVQLIQAAREGKTLMLMKLYDGSDGGQKVYDTTALIGKEIAPGTEDKLEAPGKTAGLAAVRRWPVRLTYFEPGQGERTPLYTFSFDMFENGISGSLKLDFGDFTLLGEMKTLDLLKANPCK
jgi:EipB-like